jgi:PKHD-type hydroxylase
MTPIKNNFGNVFASIPYTYGDNFFTNYELDKLTKLCSEESISDGTIGEKNELNEYRKSKVSFIGSDKFDKYGFFIQKMNQIITETNDMFFDYDLRLWDHFQYTEYHDYESGEYKEHIDMFLGFDAPTSILTRKMSISIMLNDDYEGGDFFMKTGMEKQLIPKQKGRILFFPSFVPHGVSPVTKGIKKSIVIWVNGPRFK